MNRIDIHQTCIELLEAIQTYRAYIMNTEDSLRGYILSFPTLVRNRKHDIDIYNRCIKRLEQRYQKQLNKLIQ